jgi:heparin/heparan-sulfate lyase
LRADTVDFYAQRLRDPRFSEFAEKVEQGLRSEWSGELQADPEANYDPALHDVIESLALRYVLDQNREFGARAVHLLGKVLPELTFAPVQDVTRSIGATLHTAAIVYDWCYPLLTEDDKRLIITHTKRLAGKMEVGYPPIKGGNLVGHIGEAEIFRDQLSVGIAVYDEDPEMYNLAAGRLFAELLPGREFFYPSHWHHQGSSYGKYRLAWELWAAAIFKTTNGEAIFSAHQTRLAEAWLYIQRPDGHMLPDGDVAGFAPQNDTDYRADWGQFHVHLLTTFLSGDRFIAEALAQAARQNPRLTGTLAYFLFARPEVETAPLTALPRAKYFPDPAGRLVVRTGWEMGGDSDDMIFEMKISPWNFNNHQHLDGGAFQIWCRGALASDFGFYQGSGGSYGGPHWLNYYTRTIAHNTITVTDPEEYFYFKGRPLANDGGQHSPNGGREPRNLQELTSAGYRVGAVLAQGVDPSPDRPAYAHLAGEFYAYGPKVEAFKRSFVYLDVGAEKAKGALLIYDQIRAKQADYKKVWRLNTAALPQLEESGFHASASKGGRLYGKVLLPRPENQLITLVPPEDVFATDGQQYEQGPRRGTLESADTFGWRVELSPKQTSREDRFLVALQVGAAKSGVPPLPVTIEEVGEEVRLHLGSWLVLFPKNTAHLRQKIDLSQSSRNGTNKVLATGLAAGSWRIESGGIASFQWVEPGVNHLYIAEAKAPLTLELSEEAP